MKIKIDIFFVKIAVCGFFFLFSIKLLSQNSDSTFNKGKAQFEIGNYTKALGYFNEAIALNQNHKLIYYTTGLAEFNLKNYSSAIRYFTQEIQYNPLFSNSYLYKAISLQKLQKNELALIEIETALKNDTSNVLLILEKGNIYFNQKKYNTAICFYLKALSINQKLEIAYYKLGFCEYYLKNNINACKYWKKIQDPDDFENYEIILKICK